MRKAVFLFLLTLPVWAIKGKYADPKFQHESTCKIEFSTKISTGEVLPDMCTGSLLSSKVLITAEHCVNAIRTSEPTPIPKIVCANGEESLIEKTIQAREAGLDEAQDLGFLELKTEIKAKTVKLFKTKEEEDAILEDKKSCYLAGYGKDNENNFGQLKVAAVDSVDLKPFSIGSYSSQMFRLSGNRADGGDSGGPVYCFKDGQAYLVGIHQGGTTGMEYSNSERLNQIKDWLFGIQNKNYVEEDWWYKYYIHRNMCLSFMQCLETFKSAGDLTLKMEGIVRAILKTAQEIKTEDQPTIEEMDRSWENMVDFWEKNKCFKRLYP
jgi:V8-like Glu-specific endopeptidase